jgi:hypothetical protein
VNLDGYIDTACRVIERTRETDPGLSDAVYACAVRALKPEATIEDVVRLVERLRYAGESVEAPPVLAKVAGDEPSSGDDWRSHVDLDELRRGVAQMKEGLETMRDTTQEVEAFMLGPASAHGWTDDAVTQATRRAIGSVNTALNTVAGVMGALSSSSPLDVLAQLNTGEQPRVGSPPPAVAQLVERVRTEVRHAVDDVDSMGRALLGAAAPEAILADVQRLGDLALRLGDRVEQGLDRAIEAFGAGAATATWFLWALAGLGVWAFSRGRR